LEHSQTNGLQSVEQNYLSLFIYKYTFRSFTTIIGPSVQYFEVRSNAVHVYLLCVIPQVYNSY